MAKAGYSVPTGGVVALSAATAKSVLGLKAHANFGLDLKKLRYGFDGVTASNVPVLIEFCYCTWATNSPGTNSTSITPVQEYGRVITPGFTAGKGWTAEPTVLTVIEEVLMTPNGGQLWYDFPLGDSPDCALSEGWVLRMNAPNAVNARATAKVERC